MLRMISLGYVRFTYETAECYTNVCITYDTAECYMYACITYDTAIFNKYVYNL